MSVATYEKDPLEDLDFGFDLRKWLSTGALVADLDVAADPVGLVTLHDPINTGDQVAVFVSGGQPGDKVRVSYKATTDQTPPRVFNRSLTIHVKQR